MASFIPSKKEASDFNNGVQYVNGDSVQAETVNNLVENALYTQAQAESANALVNSVVTDAFAPPLVGMHHIQFSGEPTPAEIWGGTTWELDTAYQGKTLIGSGGDYTLGATGGSPTHTLTRNEMPSVTIPVKLAQEQGGWTSENNGYAFAIKESARSYIGGNTTFNGNDTAVFGRTDPIGNGKSFEILPPYTVVNYWKRLS